MGTVRVRCTRLSAGVAACLPSASVGTSVLPAEPSNEWERTANRWDVRAEERLCACKVRRVAHSEAVMLEDNA